MLVRLLQVVLLSYWLCFILVFNNCRQSRVTLGDICINQNDSIISISIFWSASNLPGGF